MISPCFYCEYFGFDTLMDQITIWSICLFNIRRLLTARYISLYGTMVSATCCGFVQFLFFELFNLLAGVVVLACTHLFLLLLSRLPFATNSGFSSACSSVTLLKVGHLEPNRTCFATHFKCFPTIFGFGQHNSTFLSVQEWLPFPSHALSQTSEYISCLKKQSVCRLLYFVIWHVLACLCALFVHFSSYLKITECD